MIGRISATILAAAILFIGSAFAQSGSENSRQLSVEEMERALGVGQNADSEETPRFRAPSFEIGDSSSPSNPPRAGAQRSFDVPIEFAFGSTQIARSYLPTIEHVAEVLQRNPDLTLKILGHTDAVGAAETNAALSRRRAEAVRSEVLKRGIAGARISAEGAGETMLIRGIDPASSQNRRVEFLRMD